MLFSLGVAVWLIGSAIRLCLRLFQLVLLIALAGIKVYQWMQQRRRPEAIEREILPPLYLIGQPNTMPNTATATASAASLYHVDTSVVGLIVVVTEQLTVLDTLLD
jgi:hypothetical protein